MKETREISYIDRTIYLHGEINRESALNIITAIDQINAYDDMMDESKIIQLSELIESGMVDEDGVVGITPREPIILNINSGGGEVPAGHSIISAIENSETPVIGYVTGVAMSMAIAILSSCHYRMSSEYADFMIHDVYTGMQGKFNDLDSNIEYLKRVRDNYSKILVNNTKLSKEELEELVNKNADHYFSPSSAKDYGIIDGMDDEEIDYELIFQRLYPEPEEESVEIELNDKSSDDFLGNSSGEELARLIAEAVEHHGSVFSDSDMKEEPTEKYLEDGQDVNDSVTESFTDRVKTAVSYILRG